MSWHAGRPTKSQASCKWRSRYAVWRLANASHHLLVADGHPTTSWNDETDYEYIRGLNDGSISLFTYGLGKDVDFQVKGRLMRLATENFGSWSLVLESRGLPDSLSFDYWHALPRHPHEQVAWTQYQDMVSGKTIYGACLPVLDETSYLWGSEKDDERFPFLGVVCTDLDLAAMVSELEQMGGYEDFHWTVQTQMRTCRGHDDPPEALKNSKCDNAPRQIVTCQPGEDCLNLIDALATLEAIGHTWGQTEQGGKPEIRYHWSYYLEGATAPSVPAPLQDWRLGWAEPYIGLWIAMFVVYPILFCGVFLGVYCQKKTVLRPEVVSLFFVVTYAFAIAFCALVNEDKGNQDRDPPVMTKALSIVLVVMVPVAGILSVLYMIREKVARICLRVFPRLDVILTEQFLRSLSKSSDEQTTTENKGSTQTQNFQV